MVERVQYHIPDWMTGTEEMSFELEAAYRKLCDFYYLTDGHLKDDHQTNARRLKISVRKYKKYRQALIDAGKFHAVDGHLVQDRAAKELEVIYESSVKAREKAAKRWRKHDENSAKSLENNDTGDANSLTRKLDKKEKNTKKEKDELEQEFEAWWADYPRKVGKGQARRAYATARKAADADVLLAAIRAIPPPDELKFFPHAATWLNGERWLDEAGKPPTSATPKADQAAFIARQKQRFADMGIHID